MIFVGDVHGEFREYRRRLKSFGESPSIQLGDMGFGFGHNDEYGAPPQHKFIRGNHDKPDDCAKIPNYLGDYGYLPDEDIFFVSGAFSVDYMYRTMGADMWEDEELHRCQMDKALELYSEVKPKIVCTHDCPIQLLSLMYKYKRIIKTKTGAFFDELFDIHKPQAWVFGHHHRSHRYSVDGTEFFGLGILEAVKVVEETIVDYQGEFFGDVGDMQEDWENGEAANLHGRTTESG